jgi:hypothetical protein
MIPKRSAPGLVLLIQMIFKTTIMKTYEQACKKLKQEPADLTNIPAELHSLIKLTTIIQALNEDWKPNWNNILERKYIIWWYWNGIAFVSGGYDFWYGFAIVGSRLCFKNAKLAEYCAKTFGDLWNDYLQYV